MSSSGVPTLQQVVNNLSAVTVGEPDVKNNMTYLQIVYEGGPLSFQLFETVEARGRIPFGISTFEDGGVSVQVDVSNGDVFKNLNALQGRIEALATECETKLKVKIENRYFSWFRTSQRFENLLRLKLSSQTAIFVAESEAGDKHRVAKGFDELTKNSSVVPIIKLDQIWVKSKNGSHDIGATIRASAIMSWTPVIEPGNGDAMFAFSTQVAQ